MYIGDSSDSEYGDDTRVVPVFLEGEQTPRNTHIKTAGSYEQDGDADIFVESSSSGSEDRCMTPPVLAGSSNNKEFKRKKALEQAQRRKLRTAQGVISTESDRPTSATQVASPKKKSSLHEQQAVQKEEEEEEPKPARVKKAPKPAPRYEEMTITNAPAPVEYRKPVAQSRQIKPRRREVSSDSDDDPQEELMEEEDMPQYDEQPKRKRPQAREPRQGFAVSAAALAAEPTKKEQPKRSTPRAGYAEEVASRSEYPMATGFATPPSTPPVVRALSQPSPSSDITFVGTSPEEVLAFVTKPAPKAQMTMTKIMLVSKGRHPVYMVYLEDSNQFLLSARKRRSRCSNYLISSDSADLDRESSSYLGKVRSNFMGTEFTVYDKGANPKKGQQESRHELASVAYSTNVLGLAGPRKMLVLLPGQEPATNSNLGLLQRYKGGDSSSMTTLLNKAPVWNEATQAYVLNFHRRVKVASVKNFQLVEPTDHENVLLQFGRVSKSLFVLDYKYPFTLLQAFGIALTSFDKKIACE